MNFKNGPLSSSLTNQKELRRSYQASQLGFSVKQATIISKNRPFLDHIASQARFLMENHRYDVLGRGSGEHVRQLLSSHHTRHFSSAKEIALVLDQLRGIDHLDRKENFLRVFLVLN